MTDQEINEAAKDALTTGGGFIMDGKRIDPKDIYKSESEIINEAVARKLGWTFTTAETMQGNWYEPTKMGWKCGELPDYCHSIEAAMEILIYGWAEKDIHWHLMFNSVTQKYHCCIGTSENEADTAPMAICRAFLKMGDKL